MKKHTVIVAGLVFFMLSSFVAYAEQAPDSGQIEVSFSLKTSGNLCSTIQSGKLSASDGSVINTGYDQWGYNYQAHMFNGGYCDAYRNADWCQDDKEDQLMMKWNNAWLANVDCDDDGLLDRHFNYSTYIGSEAWLTNHIKGKYEQDGQVCKWEYFVKIVAAPADATLAGGLWYAADGAEIGPVIWNQFAIIQEVSNDPCTRETGILYLSPDHPGLGGW